MSMHTPGPWHLHARNYLCVEAPSGNIALCNLARDNEADAKLIAAAPELIEALRIARTALEHNQPESCWATGPLTSDPIEDLIVCPGCRAMRVIDAAIAKATLA